MVRNRTNGILVWSVILQPIRRHATIYVWIHLGLILLPWCVLRQAMVLLMLGHGRWVPLSARRPPTVVASRRRWCATGLGRCRIRQVMLCSTYAICRRMV